MLKLIKAEMYRILNRRDYEFLILITIILVIFNIAMHYLSGPTDSINVYQIISVAMSMLLGVVFFIPLILNTTTNEEIQERTLKNTVSFGIPRSKIFISKIISSVILFFIDVIVIGTGFFGSAFLLFKLGGDFTGTFIWNVCLRILCVILLYIAVIVIGVLLALIINDVNIFILAYMSLFFLLRAFITVLSMVWHKLSCIDKILITGNINILSKNPTNIQMINAAEVGFVYILIFIVLGIMIFNRKEIK
jgi:ABC-2 type transport system permease protein